MGIILAYIALISFILMMLQIVACEIIMIKWFDNPTSKILNKWSRILQYGVWISLTFIILSSLSLVFIKI